jgi:Zn-dependent protease with chaperone function
MLLASSFACLAQMDIPKLPNPGSTSISREDQKKLGFQATQVIYKQLPLLPDSSPETRYVRQLGQRLVSTIPPENSWPFDFHVVAQKEINAFALPGGEMFVNLGTLVAAQSDAQLAGVMAHEMAHVYMQHSAKQMQKAQITQGLAGLAGAILGNKGGTLGSLGQIGVQVGAGMVMLKYSRSDEAQADEVGAMIMQRTRYNPQALADFFKTLEAQGGTGPQFLSDHPNPGNREAAIQKEIAGWPPVEYQTDVVSFNKARQHAAGVKAYSAEEIAQGAKAGKWEAFNKKSGVVLTAPAGVSTSASSESKSDTTAASAVSWTDVMPSSKFVLIDTGHLQMVRPGNWVTIAPQKQGDSVTIAPRAGVVTNGIGYGVVINEASRSSRNATIDQITAEIVRRFQSGGNLQQMGSVTEITVAGVRGRSVNLQSISPFPDAKGQSQKERDLLVTIPRPDGSVVYIVFVAPDSEFDRLGPTYNRMLKSVQF